MMEEQFQTRLQKQQEQFHQHYQKTEVQLQEQLHVHLQEQLKAKDFQMEANFQVHMCQSSDVKSQISELANIKTNQ